MTYEYHDDLMYLMMTALCILSGSTPKFSIIGIFGKVANPFVWLCKLFRLRVLRKQAMLVTSQAMMNTFPWSTKLLILVGRDKPPSRGLLLPKVNKYNSSIPCYLLDATFLLKSLLRCFLTCLRK